MSLQPGEARIYTNVVLPAPLPEVIQFVRPIAPVLLSLTESNNTINVQWQDKSSIETGYSIFRRKTGGTFAKVGDVFANSQFYINVDGLEPLTTYEYAVEANTIYGSSQSNILTITTSDQITGLEQEWRGVRVFPNPTSGLVTVDLPPTLAGASWSLKNVLGQPVSFREAGVNTIDLGSNPPGLYFVMIAVNGQSRTFKVLKR
jgi:hypothetical protein